MRKVRLPGVSLVLIGLVLIGIMLVSGCSSSKNTPTKDQEKISSLQNEVNSLKKETADLKATNSDLKAKAAKSGLKEVTVYFIGSTPTSFYLAPEKRKVPADSDLKKAAIEELIKGPYYAELSNSLQPALPKGAKLLGLKVEGGLATVDFNSATQKNLNVGSSGEALVIASVVNTLTEFSEVKEVQILIEGKKVESLAGHIDISKPLKRNQQAMQKQP